MGVTGIGGFFFRAADAPALARWYADHLGVGGGEWGLWQQAAGQTVFAPFAADDEYFARDRHWMLNLRVDDLDAMIAGLAAAGIAVRTDPAWDAAGMGRFARIHDPDGNPIELWQPADPSLEGGDGSA